jgi:hypothetical protein
MVLGTCGLAGLWILPPYYSYSVTLLPLPLYLTVLLYSLSRNYQYSRGILI